MENQQTETRGQKFQKLIVMYRSQIVAAVIWLTLLLATRYYMQTNDLTFSELINELRTILIDEWYGPMLYMVVYFIRPVALFPASLLAILAGNVWGIGPGFVYGLLAGTLSSLPPYFAGRWFSSPSQVEQEESDSQEKSRFRRYINLLRRNAFRAILTMRLLYMPYDTVSLIAGGLRVAFLPFFAATVIGNIGGTIAFVVLGASIENDITTGDVSLNPAVFAFSVCVFVVMISVTYVVNRRHNNRQKDISHEEETELITAT